MTVHNCNIPGGVVELSFASRHNRLKDPEASIHFRDLQSRRRGRLAEVCYLIYGICTELWRVDTPR
jgi:hypothetical protein